MNLTSAPTEARERLGRLLTERRVQLDPRWRNRQLFVRELGLNYKLVSDIETARRTDFGGATVIALELAYGWEPGSFARVLDDREPVLLPGDGNGRRGEGLALPEDTAYLLNAIPRLTPAQQSALVVVVRAMETPPAVAAERMRA